MPDADTHDPRRRPEPQVVTMPIVRGLAGSLALSGLLVTHDGLIDGSWLLTSVVCPVWLLVALVRLRRSPAAPWGIARLLIPIVTGLAIVANAVLQRHVATTGAALLVEACERYREAHGDHPARLEDLAPRFVPAVPRAKHCLSRGGFRYSGPPNATLSWVDTPPFGRRVYSFDTRQWRTID